MEMVLVRLDLLRKVLDFADVQERTSSSITSAIRDLRTAIVEHEMSQDEVVEDDEYTRNVGADELRTISESHIVIEDKNPTLEEAVEHVRKDVVSSALNNAMEREHIAPAELAQRTNLDESVIEAKLAGAPFTREEAIACAEVLDMHPSILLNVSRTVYDEQEKLRHIQENLVIKEEA